MEQVLAFLPSEKLVIGLADKVSAALEVPDDFMYGISNQTFNLIKPVYEPYSALYNAYILGNAVVPEPFAAFAEPVLHGIRWIDTSLQGLQHPLAARLPLSHFETIFFTTVVYFSLMAVFFVVGKVLGKGSYRTFGMIHNFYLFWLSLYMAVGIGSTAIARYGYKFINNEIGDGTGDAVNDWRMAKLFWVFLLSKLPEYMDTFLMLLKHNYRQVTFLHVFHHSSVVWFSFAVNNGLPGADAFLAPTLNSSVHVVMYGYYFGTMFFSNEKHPVRRFLNAFKFIITKGQIVQFMINVVHALYCLYVAAQCRPPPYLFKITLGYMAAMLSLFGNFLIRNQGKSKKDASAKKDTTTKKVSTERKNR